MNKETFNLVFKHFENIIISMAWKKALKNKYKTFYTILAELASIEYIQKIKLYTIDLNKIYYFNFQFFVKSFINIFRENNLLSAIIFNKLLQNNKNWWSINIPILPYIFSSSRLFFLIIYPKKYIFETIFKVEDLWIVFALKYI